MSKVLSGAAEEGSSTPRWLGSLLASNKAAVYIR